MNNKLSFLLPGIKVTLEKMPDNGVLVVVTDAGTKQENLEKEIQKLSEKKNIKIFFLFAPRCRAKCENSLPVYKRLSEGRMFNISSVFGVPSIFWKSFNNMVCNHLLVSSSPFLNIICKLLTI